MTTETEHQTEAAPVEQQKEIRGYVDCPLCFPRVMVAPVLVTKKKRLYLKCPMHDTNLMTNNASQQWILDHMRDTPQRKDGDPEPTPAPIETPEKSKPAKPAKKDFLGDW